MWYQKSAKITPLPLWHKYEYYFKVIFDYNLFVLEFYFYYMHYNIKWTMIIHPSITSSEVP